jgi:RND family efflux transporter MFP subunit
MKTAHAAWLAIACALLAGGCNGASNGESHAPPVRPALTAVAERQSGALAAFAGTIEPRYSSTLAFRVVGRVIVRDVNVGDSVKKNARLAALDPLPYDLAVRDARAGLADAEAQFANAQASEKRLQALFEENHLPTQELEAAQQAREATSAGVTRAQSVLEKALEQRGYTELIADYDGVVTAVDTEVGQVVTAGQPVMTIARPDVREAVIDVPEDAAANLREGGAFEIALPSAPSQRISGRVREIAPQADPLTRSRRVKIALDNPPADFRLGTTITAYARAKSTGQIKIPATALFERDGKLHVWIVDSASKTVALRDVSVVSQEDGAAAVSAGLEPGDRVVIAGVNSLEAGQSVRIPEEAPQ